MLRREFCASFLAIGGIPLNQRRYECVVGDYYENLNGRTYNPEIWKSMCSQNMPVYMDNASASPSLLDYVGEAVELRLGKTIVTAVIRISETPAGKSLAKMIDDGVLMYMSPSGNGVIEDGQIQVYKFTHFSVNNTSAFESATPLRPERQIA